MDRARDPVVQAREAQAAEEARTRRALLHMLEDLQREHGAAKQARRHWVETVDAIADPMMVHDREMRVLRCNRAYAARAGMEFTDILGRRYWECFPKRSGPLEACLQPSAAGAKDVRETEIRLDTGETFVSRSFAIGESNAPHALHLFENVTEKRRTEATLRESEATFHALFENMLNAIAYCEVLFENGQPVDFVYRHVNAAFTSQTGLKDVLGRRVTEVIPDIRTADPGLIERYGRVAVSGVPERFELFIEALQQWHMVSLFSPKPGYFASVFDVITERKRAETMLVESERRLSLATQSAGIGIWDWDIAADKLLWDRRMYQLYGIREGNFPGVREAWHSALHPADVARVDAATAAALEGGKEYAFEFRVVWPGGEVRHIEAHAAVQRAVDGTATRMVGVNWDVTARRLAERTLRESEEKFRSIFERTHDGIVLMNLEASNAEPTVAFANRSIETLLGYADGGLLGLPLSRLHPAEHLTRLRELFERSTGGAVGVLPDVPMLKNGGAVVYADLTNAPVEFGGRRYQLGAFRDATARRENERRLREQLAELQRWQGLNLDREDRVIELKREVNELTRKLNLPPRYASGE